MELASSSPRSTSLSVSGLAGFTVSNAWDGFGRLAEVTSSCPGLPAPVAASYTYYPAGQVSNVTTVAGTTGYGLDEADRLAAITPPQGGTFTYAYNPWNGLAAAVSNPSGLSAEYAYDILDRPTNITYKTSGGAELMAFEYAYDAVGQVTNATKVVHGIPAVPASSTAYAYDSLGRLVYETTQAAGSPQPEARGYAYDLSGNRTASSRNGAGTAYAYQPGCNRLASSSDGATYTHDAAGNITRIIRNGVTMDLEWDIRYQLIAVSTNGVPAEAYTYDPLGRRASTATAEGTVYHVYDGIHCAADLDPSGNLLMSYTYGPGVDNLLAVSVHASGAPVTYHTITDRLGTVHALADSAGNIAASYQYDAWGNVLSSTINSSLLTINSFRFLFQGREYSCATGLYNFRARWYDPVTGRWLSNDPIGISGGLNQYVFCDNDPVNCQDPYGLTSYKDGEKTAQRYRQQLHRDRWSFCRWAFCFPWSIDEVYQWSMGEGRDLKVCDPDGKYSFRGGVYSASQQGNINAAYAFTCEYGIRAGIAVSIAGEVPDIVRNIGDRNLPQAFYDALGSFYANAIGIGAAIKDQFPLILILR